MNEHIFLVDDETLLTMSLSRSLFNNGYRTTSFQSAEACLEALAGGDLPDIILMDINFGPGRISGPEATERIHREFDIPVVLHSAYTDGETLNSIREMTKYGYIQKFPGNEQFVQANIEMALKLFNSEKRYRELFYSSNDAVFLHSIGNNGVFGKFFEVNDAACNYLGYSREELLQMSPQDIDSPSGRRQMPGIIEELREKKRITFESEHLAKDGHIIPVEISSHQFILKQQPTIISSVRDISERKKYQKELQQSEELHRTTLSSISDTVFLTKEDGRFVYVCPNVDVIFGISEAETLQFGNISCFFEDLLAGSEVLDKAGEISNIEQSIRDSRGKEHVVLVNVKRVSIKGATRLYTCRDITQLKRKEKDLQKSEKMYRELSNHLQNVREEQSEYIAREIHDDLGQSITALKMNLTMIDKSLELMGGEARVEKIYETTEDMKTILNKIVTKIRALTSELRPPVLDTLGIIEAIKWHIHEFVKQFGVPTELTTGTEEVLLGKDKSLHVFRIVQEALTNCIRHGSPSKINIRINISDNVLCITVTDDGKGFDQQTIPIEKQYGILGMQERARQCGGMLSLKSTLGRGTQVSLEIPAE